MEETPWYVSLIIAWLPFIAWIVSVIWVAVRIARVLETPDGHSLASVVDGYGRELKRSNDMLEQLVTEHRKRLEVLEQRE